MAGFLAGMGGLFIEAIFGINPLLMPIWAWIIVVTALAIVAPFFGYHKLFKDRQSDLIELDKLKSGHVEIDRIPVPDDERKSWRICVHNRSRKSVNLSLKLMPCPIPFPMSFPLPMHLQITHWAGHNEIRVRQTRASFLTFAG